MLTTIGIIGSIASIIGIPAGWYWFKKSQNDKFNSIKNEIIRTAKGHYGKNGYIDLNQLGAVIRTKLRRGGFDIKKITTGEIIDELVTQAIDEPLIDPMQKDKLLYELKRLSTNNKVQKLLSHNSKLLSSPNEKDKMKGERLQYELSRLEEFQDNPEQKERFINERIRIDFDDVKFGFINESFTNSFKLISIIGSIASLLGIFTIIQQFDFERYGDLLWIGVSIIVGLLLSVFYDSISRILSRKKVEIKEYGDIEDIDFIEIQSK